MNLQKIFDNIKIKSEFRRVVELQGTKYELGILSVDEEIKANVIDPSISESEAAAVYETIKKQILSFSIRNIDGTEIPDIVEVEEGEGADKKIHRKERPLFMKEALRSWNSYLVDALFEVYIDIKEEAESKLKNDMKYIWFKDPEERKKELLKKLERRKEEPVEESKEDLKAVDVK